MNDRLYRSRHDRRIAGVAGGLAELWDLDPSLVRIVWALLVIFTGGLALLVYIVMAIVVPDQDEAYPMAPSPPGGAADPQRIARAEARAARRVQRAAHGDGGGPSGGIIFGMMLIVLGVFFLARELLPSLNFDWLWPVGLIALGGVLLIGALGRKPTDSPGPTSPADSTAGESRGDHA